MRLCIYILKALKQHQGEELKKEEADVGINVGTNVGTKEQKIFTIISNTPQATAKDMAEIMGVSQRQCERLLAKLRQEGRIRRVGANKSGRWEIEKWE